MDLGPPLETIMGRARPSPGQRNHHDHIRESQSHYSIKQSLLKPDSTSAGLSQRLLTLKSRSSKHQSALFSLGNGFDPS
jgi:hypothetical protein